MKRLFQACVSFGLLMLVTSAYAADGATQTGQVSQGAGQPKNCDVCPKPAECNNTTLNAKNSATVKGGDAGSTASDLGSD